MTVTELIAALNDQTPDSNVVINVGGTQVEDFDVDVDEAGVVNLRGREESVAS